jgi:hypothetical protein
MPLRRPPFGLVLALIIGTLAGALALTSGGGGPAGPPSLIGSTPAHACMTAQATVTSTARAAARARMRVRLPIVVTAHVVGRGGAVSATRSETIVAQAGASRPVIVQRTAVVSRRACAQGDSLEAARGTALTRAYKNASRVATVEANKAARNAAKTLVSTLAPAELSQARKLAIAKATAAASAERAVLQRQALAQARAHAGR